MQLKQNLLFQVECKSTENFQDKSWNWNKIKFSVKPKREEEEETVPFPHLSIIITL